MKNEHKTRIRQNFRDIKLPPIQSLDIPDDYEFMDDALIELITDGAGSALEANFDLSTQEETNEEDL